MSREHWMTYVCRLALEKQKLNEGGPFAAVVVRDNQIVAEAWNQVIALNDPTAHAEVQAIRKACVALQSFQLEGCELFSSCEPCPMCLGAIFWARPQVVYYAATHQMAAQSGFDDAFIYQEISRTPASRKIPFIHCQEHQAAAETAFKEWDRNPNRRDY